MCLALCYCCFIYWCCLLLNAVSVEKAISQQAFLDFFAKIATFIPVYVCLVILYMQTLIILFIITIMIKRPYFLLPCQSNSTSDKKPSIFNALINEQ